MNHLMKCHYCKKTFRAFRSDARFCSDACRVGYSQLNSRLKSKAGNSFAGMIDVYDIAKKFPEKLPEAKEQLDWIEERLRRVREMLLEIKEA